MISKQKLIDFLQLIRWKNILIYWFTIGLFCNKFHKPSHNHQFFLIIFLFFTILGIAGNLHNNYMDYELDKLKPRFVPFDKKLIKKIFIGLYLSDFILIFFAYPIYRILMVSLLLMILYNIFFKKIAFIGNFIIAIITALSILMPYWTFQNLKNNIWIFLISMIIVITLIRELIKDMEDSELDKKFDYKTLPLINNKLSYWFLYLYLILFYFILIQFKTEFTSLAFYIFLIFSTAIFGISMLNLFHKNYEKITQLIKLLMLAGIIFFVYGNQNIG